MLSFTIKLVVTLTVLLFDIILDYYCILEYIEEFLPGREQVDPLLPCYTYLSSISALAVKPGVEQLDALRVSDVRRDIFDELCGGLARKELLSVLLR